jgi:hypothetical protein
MINNYTKWAKWVSAKLEPVISDGFNSLERFPLKDSIVATKTTLIIFLTTLMKVIWFSITFKRVY